MKSRTEEWPYEDIVNPPHHVSKKHPHMPMIKRAAQFAPFAALSGFDTQIGEEARLTNRRPVLSDEEAAEMNEVLCVLAESTRRLRVRLTVFVPDASKSGGALLKTEGVVRRVDFAARQLIFADKTVISLDDIFSLAIL